MAWSLDTEGTLPLPGRAEDADAGPAMVEARPGYRAKANPAETMSQFGAGLWYHARFAGPRHHGVRQDGPSGGEYSHAFQ